MSRFPHRRSDNVLTEEMDGELLVYDLLRHRAHCLNESVGRLFGACDGRRDIAALARATGLAEPLVELGLQELSAAHLLTDPLPDRRLPSRRQFVRRFGIALVPAVVTVLVPRAAQAASCVPLGGSCSSKADCCPPLNCTGVGHKTCQPP